MGLALKNIIIDKYLGFLTRLDNVTKKKLIIKPTELLDVKEKNSFNLASLSGAWEDSRTSDEIINDLKNSRIEKNNSINS